MSEKIPHIGDKLQPLGEQELQGLEELAKNNEKETTKTEKEHGAQEQIAAHRKKVEQQAISGKERAIGEKEARKSAHPVIANKHLKQVGFDRALTRARKKLSPAGRTFSKVIHNPVVDQSSEFIGKTVARPNSMLSGSIFALIGTGALIWATNHYGYSYNYLAIILLFIIGAFAGLLLEAAWKLVKRR